MILVLSDILTRDESTRLAERVAALRFVEGASTAGWHARGVKNNLQADRAQPEYGPLNKEMIEAILRHRTFRMAARPRQVSALLFSRYRDSMGYGAHLDDPLQHGLRSDVSFTLFLSDPATYDGGELVMESGSVRQSFKLPPGELVLYPSTMLHRVNPVTRGERLAAVGWCQSDVRDASKREILCDLELALRSLFEKDGKSREADHIARSHANLVRMWVEA